MIIVSVSDVSNRLTQSFSSLSKIQVDRAVSIAMNKTIMKARTVARTAVKQTYNIPQKNLSGVNVMRAKPSNLRAFIHVSSRPIPMDAFSPRFEQSSGGIARGVTTISKRGVAKTTVYNKLTASRQKQQGVSIEVKKGERTSVPFAFMLPGTKPRIFARGEYEAGSGSWGFLKRNKRKNNEAGNDDVKPLVSVTLFGAVVNPKVQRDLDRVVRADYERNLMTAMRYQLSKMR